MKKRAFHFLTALALLATCLFQLAACGVERTALTQKETANAHSAEPETAFPHSENGAKDLLSGVKAAPVQALPDLAPGGEKAADFALKLFRAVQKDGKNSLVSPLSVLSALAMTANGANGETKSQMEEVFGMKTEEWNPFLYSLRKALAPEEKAALSLADSVWFTNDARFSVKGDFLQTLADFYDAGAYQTPFDESTRNDMNAWVNENTRGMIPEILDEVPHDAVMYLVNALAFEAEWQKPYTEDQVRDGYFTTASGEDQKTEMMYDSVNEYLETEKATGFLRRYAGKYAFAALLPKENAPLSELIASLSGTDLAALFAAPSRVEVRTSMPKFEVKDQMDLGKTLAELGMPRAFDPAGADFSALGTYENRNIYIGRVLHKTFLSVAEQGTRAGAATVVEMTKNAAVPITQPKEVYLDRPFLYFLIDTETNAPFMIGTLENL